jgi:UDP-glucose 4-epimerase
MAPGDRRVLVTGAAGFIGSYLIPALLDRGASVVAFDLAREPSYLRPVLDKISYVQGDLASSADLYRAVMRYRITDVFHLGAILAGPCDEDPVRAYQVNVQSTLTLLDAAVALAARRFVMVSSIAVFGKGAPEPVRDDAIKDPANMYGQTKLASEHLLTWYARRRGLDCRAVRFAWVFGPGRKTGITALYSSLLLDAIALGRPVNVVNPDERGDWLYVKDAVKALLLAWETEAAPQRIYNIAGGVHAVRDVVEIARRYRPDAAITYAVAGAAASPYPAAYDDEPGRRELGWRPDYAIDDAVREHLETVARHGA